MGIISRLEWVSTLIGMDFIDFIDFLDFIDFIDWVKPSLIDVFFFLTTINIMMDSDRPILNHENNRGFF